LVRSYGLPQSLKRPVRSPTEFFERGSMQTAFGGHTRPARRQHDPAHADPRTALLVDYVQGQIQRVSDTADVASNVLTVLTVLLGPLLPHNRVEA
jgi:hypothetical protein